MRRDLMSGATYATRRADRCTCRCASCQKGKHCHNMANGCHIRTW